MSEPNELPDHERLASDPELGDVLRRANLEYRAGLDESAAFRRVGEQLTAETARPRHRRHAATALGLVCAAAAGWLVWLQAGRIGTPEVLLGPEVSVGDRSLGAEPARVSPESELEPHQEPALEAPVPSAAAVPGPAACCPWRLSPSGRYRQARDRAVNCFWTSCGLLPWVGQVTAVSLRMQRKPIWLMPLSTICAWRAAER